MLEDDCPYRITVCRWYKFQRGNIDLGDAPESGMVLYGNKLF